MKIIKKHTGAIHIKNRLSLLQRKISNVLLYFAYNQLLKKDIHEIQIKELANEVGFNSNDIELLKEALRKLVTVKIEWNILDENQKDEWGVCSSLSEAVIKDGVCRYAYPPTLREKLFHPAYYAKINLQIQRTINGGYALALYENLVRYKKIGTTDWIEVQIFRELMGADLVKSYDQFKDLNKYVIKPAIKEINRVTDIIVDVTTKRSGRQIKYLKFSIQEKKQLTIPFIFNDEEKSNHQLTQRLMKLGFKRETIEEILGQYDDHYIIKHLDYVEKKIANGDKIKSATGYFISALKNDYDLSPMKDSIKNKQTKIKIDIKPGMTVIYDNTEHHIAGELGSEYIEFYGGRKMDRETILNFLINRTMSLATDQQGLSN